MAEAKGGTQDEPTGERAVETDPAHQGYARVALGVMAAISRNERPTMILNVRNGSTIAGLPADRCGRGSDRRRRERRAPAGTVRPPICTRSA